MEKQPLATLILLAYNQEKYIAEAVDSVLAQNFDSLEIILSDDHSSDRTYEIIRSRAESYSGPHILCVNRNSENLGLSAHFNKLLSMARGEIIVVSAGDDISLGNRVADTVKVLESNPQATLVSLSSITIDENGKRRLISSLISRISLITSQKIVTLEDFISGKSRRISGASRGFRRSLYNDFGPLNRDCPTEDTPMVLRGLLRGYAVVSQLPGIYYRRHGNNLSGATRINQMDFDCIRRQYLEDLEKANNSELITASAYGAVKDWIDYNYSKRLTVSRLHKNGNTLFDTYNYVLKSKNFSVIEKIRSIKECLVKSI